MTVEYLLIESALRSGIALALGTVPDSRGRAEPFASLEQVRRYSAILRIAKEAKADVASVEKCLAGETGIGGAVGRRIERAIASHVSKSTRGLKP
jgi:hypothetical protein